MREVKKLSMDLFKKMYKLVVFNSIICYTVPENVKK